MAKDDQQEAYEKLLLASLSRVIDFVRFAETKNAALLTFSSAWILASVNLLFGTSRLTSDEWVNAFSIALPCFIVAGVFAIASFLPRLSLAGFHRDPDRSRSLLYFGDAAEYDAERYKKALNERYFPEKGFSATQNYLDDLSIQINVNSLIAVRKFNFFKFGAIICLVALVVLLIPSLIYFGKCTITQLQNLLKP